MNTNDVLSRRNAQDEGNVAGAAGDVATALDDVSETIRIEQTVPPGIERLLVATARLIDNDENDPMKVAVRVAVEQLRRKDSGLRRECLMFAAEQLADARSRWRVHGAQDEILLDLLRAACLARTGKDSDARALVNDARDRARDVVQRRADELARLDAVDASTSTSTSTAKLRAASLRAEPVLGLDDIEMIAADV